MVQYSSDIVWSINIMCAILLVGVAYVIYWIFKYDDWYPNEVSHNSIADDIDDVYSTGDSSDTSVGMGETTTISRDVT